MIHDSHYANAYMERLHETRGADYLRLVVGFGGLFSMIQTVVPNPERQFAERAFKLAMEACEAYSVPSTDVVNDISKLLNEITADEVERKLKGFGDVSPRG